MEDEALEYSFGLFQNDGYTGSKDQYSALLKENPEAVEYSYGLFKNDGYGGTLQDFQSLMGIVEPPKKKEDTELQLVDGSLAQPTIQAPKIDTQPEVETQTVVETTEIIPEEDPDLPVTLEEISKDEEFILPKLNYKFKNDGFVFEETGLTDNVKVTAPNNETITIGLDAFTTAQNREERDRLNKFIDANKQDTLQINKAIEKYDYKKMIFENEKEIQERMDALNEEANSFSKNLNNYLYEQSVLEEEGKALQALSEQQRRAQKDRIDKYNQEMIRLNKSYQQIQNYYKDFEFREKQLNAAVGEYYDMKRSQGSMAAGLVDSFLRGVGEIPAGIVDLAIDIGGKVPRREMTEEEKIASDKRKKEFKEKVLPPIREFFVETFGGKDVSEQWMMAQQQKFFPGAFLGLARSLPALLAPGGKFVRIPALFAQVNSQYQEEFKDLDLTEDEKALLKVPLSLVIAQLENFGFRNVLGNSSLVKRLLFNVAKKVPTNANASVLNDFIRNEIKSKLGRAGSRFTTAALAEAETGAFQEAADIGGKELFESLKGKDLFQTPEGVTEILSEIAYAAGQEAVGGFVLGTLPAISDAYAQKDFTRVDKEVLKMFLNIRNDRFTKKAFVQQQKQRIEKGELTKEEAQNELENFDKAAGLANQIPTDISLEKQQQILGLLASKQELQNEKADKDPATVGNIDQQIQQIDNQIEQVLTKEQTVEEPIPDFVEEQEQEVETETQLTEEQQDIDAFFGEEVEETTETVESNLSVNRAGETVEKGAEQIQRENNVTKIARTAASAIKNLLPNTRIVIHENESEYLKFAAPGRGELIGDTIHINLSKATGTTVPHEVFHAVFLSKIKTDPKAAQVAEKMMMSVRKTLSNDSELARRIDTFAESYQDVSELQNEERLAELIGIMASEYQTLTKPQKNIVIKFIEDLARTLGVDLNLTEFTKTDNDVIDLLNTLSTKVTTGEEITEGDVEILEDGTNPVGDPTEIRVPKPRQQIEFEESYPLSLVTPDKRIDIMSLIEDINAKKEKVWFWVADQLGLGEFEGIQLDAGPSYAFDGEAVWASSKSTKSIEKNINLADYLFIISGSPERSLLFNKKVYDVFISKLGDYDTFKADALATNPVKAIRDVLNNFDSWEALRDSPQRKAFLNAVVDQQGTPNTEFHKLIKSKDGFINPNDLRDGFYKANDFNINDVMLVIKPTSARDGSQHSTYNNEVLGEVLGVPDVKVDAFDIMPQEMVDKYKKQLTQQEKSQAVAPYGSGIREISPRQRRQQKIQTGKPFNFTYKRNTEKALDRGSEFGQDVEPAGIYVTEVQEGFIPQGFESGQIEIKNPLVIKITDDTLIEYKRNLSKKYNNQKGIQLTESLKADGYDGIVTQFDDGTTSEIILLNLNIDSYKTQRRQQRTIEQVAQQYNMDNQGFIPKTANLSQLRKAVAPFGLEARRAREDQFGRGGGLFLVRDGRKFNPFAQTTRRRQQRTPADYIREGREAGFRDELIVDYLKRVQKLRVKDIKELMGLDSEILGALPESFKNIKGGAKAGLKLFNKIESLIKKENNLNNRRKNKLTDAQIMDKAVAFLENQVEYKNEADTYKVKGEAKARKTLSTQQALMLSDLQKTLNQRPTKDIAIKIRAARALVRARSKGQRDLQKVKRELRNFMRKTLPPAIFTKKEALQLVQKIEQATNANIENIMEEVIDLATAKNNVALQNQINKILTGKYEVLVSGRKKAIKIDLDTRKRIEAITNNVLPPTATEEEISDKNEALNREFLELAQDPNQDPFVVNKMVDLQIAINLNNASLLENTDANKTLMLDQAFDALSGMVQFGRSVLKAQIESQAQEYRRQFAELYYDITGNKLNLDDPDLNEQLENEKFARNNATNRRKVKNRAATLVRNIMREIDNFFFGSQEALDGLMDRISSLPGELFGGRAQVLVTDKIDAASREFKKRRLVLSTLLDKEMANYLGANWRKRNKQFSQLEATGIYKNPERVAKAQQEYEKDPTSVDKKQKVDNIIDEEEIYQSQNQLYYMYNQFKDPANRGAFEAMYGEQTDRIMEEIENYIDPDLKRFADWQVNVLYPTLYTHYNEAYKKIYRTDLPMNKYYAGYLVREGTAPNELDLLGDQGIMQTAVGSASTKARSRNNKKIIYTDGTTALTNYIDDMEYFAAYSSAIRDINKLFTNQYIKDAIRNIHGQRINSLIDDAIKKIASRGREKSYYTPLLDGLNTAFLISRLGISPVIMIKQLTSLFTYANDIGIANWLKYAAKNKSQQLQVFKEIRDNSVYMQDRNNNSILRQIENYSENEANKVLPLGARTKDWIVNFLMAQVIVGDRTAIMLGGAPNYSYYKDQFKKNNPNATEQEAIDHAIIKFERDTKRTQQSSDLQDKDFYQTKGPLTRAANMFLTTPKQYFRKEIQAVRALNRKLLAWDRQAGKGTIGENIRTFVMYHIFMPVLFQYVTLGLPGLLREFRDDDDEDLWRAAIIGNLNAIFIWGQVFTTLGDKLTGKPWTASKDVGILAIAKAVTEKFNKAERTKDPRLKAQYMNDFYLELAQASGLPLLTVKKLVNNYSKVLDSKDMGEAILRLFNFSEYAIKGRKKRQRSSRVADKELKMLFPDLYDEIKAEEQDPEIKKLEKEIKDIEKELLEDLYK